MVAGPEAKARSDLNARERVFSLSRPYGMGSSLLQRLDAKTVKAFARGQSFGRQPTMDSWFNPQDELTTEFLSAQRLRQYVAVGMNQFNHLFDRRAQFGIDLRF